MMDLGECSLLPIDPQVNPQALSYPTQPTWLIREDKYRATTNLYLGRGHQGLRHGLEWHETLRKSQRFWD